MDKSKQWLQWAVELQSLAQAGLAYGKDVYDLERYERIREIAAEILSRRSDVRLFFRTSGYFLCRKRTAGGLCPAAGVT